jgi:predicted nuclease of predicted toxin-antitoxin system
VNRLFTNLYLDENVDTLVAKILRTRGYDVLTTDEAKRKGTSDPSQLKFAVGSEMAIATMDRVDFELLAKEHY